MKKTNKQTNKEIEKRIKHYFKDNKERLQKLAKSDAQNNLKKKKMKKCKDKDKVESFFNDVDPDVSDDEEDRAIGFR